MYVPSKSTMGIGASSLRCEAPYIDDIFMPPLKKHIVLQLSVGRSVDQVLSGQYLLTPSLDQYQTWCRGCPQ